MSHPPAVVPEEDALIWPVQSRERAARGVRITRRPYLRRHGYRILARNYSCRFGEIDIIASDRHYVVFVEVKLRASDRFVRAGAYVTPAKQTRIRTAASLWLAEHETPLQPRFDVIEIYGDADTPRRQRRINQIENAFE